MKLNKLFEDNEKPKLGKTPDFLKKKEKPALGSVCEFCKQDEHHRCRVNCSCDHSGDHLGKNLDVFA